MNEVESEKEKKNASSFAYSRAQFEPGEVDELKAVFEDVAKSTKGSTIEKARLRELVTSGGLKGYEGVGESEGDPSWDAPAHGDGQGIHL